MLITNSPTLSHLWRQRATTATDQPAVWIKRTARFEPVSWRQLAADVRRAAAALAGLGVGPGDRVAQASENRYEWIVADLALLCCQAVHVPLHASLSGEQIAWMTTHSEAKLLLLSGPSQWEKLKQHGAAGLPLCVSYEPISHETGQRIENWTELLAGASESTGEQLEARAATASQPNDLATILYTSGTTGEPKGVMLSQGNLISNAVATTAFFDADVLDIKLNFLPLSHIFARTCDLYTWLARGSQLALATNRETVLDDCRDVHPTMLNGVPYFFDKVCRLLTQQGQADTPGALAALLGGNIRLCCSGGAPLANEVFDFFERQQVPLRQGYGLTETSPVITLSNRTVFERGSVGRVIEGAEVRIADDGEILVRGSNVMLGYWKNPQATAEVMRQGWLATGDVGQLSPAGYLRITGRIKELIVTTGGKKVAPAHLESLLTLDPLIAQALVVGDGRKYLAALIVPHPEALRAEIVAQGIAVTSRAEALVHPQVLALYEEHIHQRLASLSPYEQVRRFVLLDRAFTIENGELTPKLSLRRKVIEQNFANQIELLYV